MSFQVTTVDNLFTLDNNDYIVIDGIDFQGANQNAIKINSSSSDHCIIQNCNISFSGKNGIVAGFFDNTDLLVYNCTVTDSNSSGMLFPSSSLTAGIHDSTISNCTINRSGMFAGHLDTGASAGWGVGIKTDGPANTIQYNSINYTGGMGIKFYNSNTLIQENLITNTLQNLSDLGAIYTYNAASTTPPGTTTNNRILNNIVLYAGPSPFPGDTTHSDGIYLDNKTNGLTVDGNTVAFCATGSGILVNYAFNSSITNNNVYSCWRDLSVNDSNRQSIIHSFDVSHNVFVVSDSSQQANVNTGTVTSSTLGTCTMTIASPAVISYTNHLLSINDIVTFTTTGSLPTGISVGVDYYIISSGFGASSFRISTSLGGAAVNTSGSQSGTHTLIKDMPVDLSYNFNCYARPTDSNQATSQQIIKGSTHHTLSSWQAAFIAFPWDTNSVTAAIVSSSLSDLYFNYNASTTPLVVTLPSGNYVDVATGTAYPTTRTIPAYGSVIMQQP